MAFLLFRRFLWIMERFWKLSTLEYLQSEVQGMTRRQKHVRMFILFIFLACLTAQSMAVEGELELGTVMSNYVWRGIRMSEGPVYQLSGTVSAKGFSANVWGNYDFDSKEYNETDLTLSYGKDIKKLSLEAGFIHYAMVNTKDTDEIYGGFSVDVPLQPSFKAYFDVNSGGGAFLQPSIGHSVKISSRASLDFRLNIGIAIYNSSMGVRDSGQEYAALHNAELNVACPVKLSKHWNIKPQVGVTTPLSRAAREAIRNSSAREAAEKFNGTIVYGGATLSYSF
jgi:hypothetical protein